MAGSAADTPAASTGPQFIRVSDADRDEAIDELKREFSVGRLSHETFMLRMQSALGARNQGQLDGLFTDLPRPYGRLARLREALRGWRWQRAEPDLDDFGTEYRQPGFEVVPEPYRVPRQVYPGPAEFPVPEKPPAPLRFPPGSETSFTIGRDQRCDLCLTDLSVSRLHAKLTRDDEGWRLDDLGSTNGTRLNGWRVRAPVPVQAGDLVRFGTVSFVMQSEPGDLPGTGPRGLRGPEDGGARSADHGGGWTAEDPDGGAPSG